MTDMTDETKGDGMTIEKVREYADAVSLCSSPENVSRFNQAAGRWVYINLDAIEASLSRQVSVSDEDVAKAWLIFDGQFYADRRGIESMSRMRAVLEADRAGRGVVVSSSLHARLSEIVEWEATGVLCDGELRKAARQHAEKFSMPVSSTLDIAKHEAWREAAALLLAQCKYVMPAGWKLVPVEPTDEMLKSTVGKWTPDTIWKAMLAAAPQPGAEGGV